MPAHEFEADEALSEGVKIHWFSTIKNMETSSITVEKMQVVNGKPFQLVNTKLWKQIL